MCGEGDRISSLALDLRLADSLPLLSPTGTDMAVFCLLCGKRFQAQSALQQHMEVHAGVRSYICSECNRTFPSHTALKRHLRSHTGRLVPGGAWGHFQTLYQGLTSKNIWCVLGREVLSLSLLEVVHRRAPIECLNVDSSSNPPPTAHLFPVFPYTAQKRVILKKKNTILLSSTPRNFGPGWALDRNTTNKDS